MHALDATEIITHANTFVGNWTPDPGGCHVVVVGNEKGGTGKSTTALHVIVSLLRQGRRVASVDLDARQWSLSRYFTNRAATIKAENLDLPLPDHWRIRPSEAGHRDAAEAEERERFQRTLAALRQRAEVIVIDCAGGERHLGRLAHAAADTLITPLNDSFVDFDLLAHFDPRTGRVGGPSVYAEFVWECRKTRAAEGGKAIDWVVLRNRLSHIDTRDKRRIGAGLEALSARIGFRLAPGLSERVIYRELFTRGLTMLDLRKLTPIGNMRMSDLAARQEVRAMVEALSLPPAGEYTPPAQG